MKLTSVKDFMNEHYVVDEGIKPELKEFIKDFNNQVKFFKDDLKYSDTNGDWYGRLESLSILISKQLKLNK